MKNLVMASLAAMIAAYPLPLAALGLEDLETFEQLESMDLFAAAISAAEADDIPRARALLEQALGTSGAAQGRAEAERAIAAAESRERERIRAEEEARRLAAEEEERRRQEEQEEAARAAAAARRSTEQPSAGSQHRCISVTADCTPNLGSYCTVEEITISDGPGIVDNSWSSPSICSGYQGALAGVYSYSLRLDNKVCGGQFRIPTGVQGGVHIQVYSDGCGISYVNDW